ncbi:MAG: hypothetical protein GY719_18840, partial [bacterium]|nr:hypothetical protein [bacterium]
MKRIRIVFVLLALVLLVVLGLVVDRALDSVAAARTLRHRALADRIVDELERELTAWLRREEDRPFSQYRYFFVPEGSPTQLVNLTRSPLSQPPGEPFVVCYFQLDPDGTVSSPLWPDNEQLASVAAGWNAQPEIRAFVDLVGEAVRDFWNTENAAGDLAPAVLADEPEEDAGTTVALERPGRKGKAKKVPEMDDELKAEVERQAAARGYFESLNRGARSRSERPTKVEPSQAADVYNFLENRANVLQQAVESQADAVEARERQQELLPTTPEIEQSISEVLETEASATIDVRLQPMVGRLATPEHLVLYRTVSIGEEIYRQGVMIDVPALIEWVSGRVLSDGDLAARARVALAGSPDREDWRDLPETLRAVGGFPGTYTYRHRFEEPFDAVAAEISLDPLPERQGLVNLYSLSLLLAFAAIFGLFALYRMVAVVVTYAERRNNFVSAVTHELKTPLTAIRMYGEMLRDGMVDGEGKRQQYYEIMTSETERLTRLVQNVLELSQLEQKKRSMKMEVGDVVPVVEEVLDVLRPHAEEQGFSFLLSVAEELPEVRYDRDALVQVLFNLVDNALKYSSEARDKEIVLSCRREGDGVVLSVADHGPGVARAHLRKI